MPAGARVMPYWSNIPRTSEFTFEPIDPSCPRRAREAPARSGHAIVAGSNYGQGSSRENAALAPRYLGLRVVIAKSFARIHWQNLVNFGVLPLTFVDAGDYDRIAPGSMVTIAGIHAAIGRARPLRLRRPVMSAATRGASRALPEASHPGVAPPRQRTSRSRASGGPLIDRSEDSCCAGRDGWRQCSS